MVGHTSLSALKIDPAVSPYVPALRYPVVTADTATQYSRLKAQSGSWLSLCRG